MKNQFGKLSKLLLETEYMEGRTVLRRVEFTAPFKIMKPFPRRDGGLMVMQQMASVGIMEGDRQYQEVRVGDGCRLLLTTQSFEKIFKMQGDCAERGSHIYIGRNADFTYEPLPVIPFEKSAFAGTTTVRIADGTGRFSYREIIACGRAGMGERFRFRSFRNRMEIYEGDRLIYYDNAVYEPGKIRVGGLGFFEGYTHLLTWIIVNSKLDSEKLAEIRELLDAYDTVDGGVTVTEHGDFVVKAFGQQAETLMNLCGQIKLRITEEKQCKR